MSDQQSVDTVREMAKLSILSERISEVQEKNIKMYPFIAFDGVKSAEISYDLSGNTKAFIVEYKLQISDSEKMDNIQKRYSALETWIRSLLWKEVNIRIYFNDISTYTSKELTG